MDITPATTKTAQDNARLLVGEKEGPTVLIALVAWIQLEECLACRPPTQ